MGGGDFGGALDCTRWYVRQLQTVAWNEKGRRRAARREGEAVQERRLNTLTGGGAAPVSPPTCPACSPPLSTPGASPRTTHTLRAVPPQILDAMRFNPATGHYLPLVFFNDFWLLKDKLVPVRQAAGRGRGCVAYRYHGGV